MCIINNTYGFIFVHIPKCGGTSVTHALSSLTTYQDIELGGTAFGEEMHRLYSKRYNLAKHSTAREIRSVVGHPLWKKYLTFTLVRNPYHRAVSAYTYLKKHDNENPAMKEIDDINQMLASSFWEERGPDRLFDSQVQWTKSREHFVETDIDLVGKLEEGEQVMARVLSSIGLKDEQKKSIALEKKNESGKETFNVQMTSKSAERILNRYAEDFEQFGYAKQLPESLMMK